MFSKLKRYRGLMVLALWQTAPIGVDQYGRTRLGIGAGAGQLEYTTISCDGSVIDAQAIPYANVGAELEHWLVPHKVRAHVAGGYQWADSLSARGTFGVALLAYEGQSFGIGAGVGLMPAQDWLSNSEYTIGHYIPALQYPTTYVRIGNRDRVHFRAEFLPPGVNAPVDMLRFTVGYNQFDMTKPSILGGIAVIAPTIDEEGSMGLVGQFFRPVSPNVAVGAHGFLSPGKRHAQTGVSAQVRVKLN